MNSNLIIDEYEKAGDILFSEGYYRQAIIIYWAACRFLIFSILSKNEIHYASTRQALLEFIKYNKNNVINSQVWFLESVATLCEWDPKYQINKKQAIKIKYIFKKINHYGKQ